MKLSKPTRFGLAALALAGSSAAFADAPPLYSQGFDDLASSGWLLINNSAPAGTSWFQGVPESLTAQAGAADSFAMATYLSALNGSGAIDNWLISPEIALNGAATLSFWARSEDTAGFSDTMKVYFNAGAAASTASFTSLLSSVTATTAGWTQYSVALPDAASGRIAFDYFAANADTANVIAIDSVSISAVPEPTTYALLGLGLCAIACVRRQARAQI